MDGEGDPRSERAGRERGPGDGSRGRGSGRGGREIVSSKSVDYSDNELATRETIDRKKSRSKSTDDVTERNAQPGTATGRRVASQQQQTEAQATQTAYPYTQFLISHIFYTSNFISCGNSLIMIFIFFCLSFFVSTKKYISSIRRSRTLPGKSTIGTNTTPTGDSLTDSHTLKRLLKPMSTTGSVATSPEMSRRIYHHDGYISEPEIRHVSSHTQPGKRATDTLRRVHERSKPTHIKLTKKRHKHKKNLINTISPKKKIIIMTFLLLHVCSFLKLHSFPFFNKTNSFVTGLSFEIKRGTKLCTKFYFFKNLNIFCFPSRILQKKYFCN